MVDFGRFFRAQALRGNLIAPASSILPITSSPDEFAEGPTRAIYVTTSGTIDCVDLDGNTTVGLPVFSGSIIPIALVKVTAITTAVLYAMR